MDTPRIISATLPFTAADELLAEGLSATRRPDGYAVMLLDLEAAEAFRLQRTQRTGVELTHMDLWIRALALTAGRDAHLNATATGRQLLVNDSVDIGLSVATDTAVAPVIVLRGVQHMDLEAIHAERARLLRESSANRDERRRELERQARVLPIRPLRRKLVNYLVNRADFRRREIGTLHISAIDLPDMEFYLPCHLGTSLLLSVGGVKKRPVVVGDAVEARLSAYCAFMIDQRAVHPVRAMRCFHRFRRLLERPEKLLSNAVG